MEWFILALGSAVLSSLAAVTEKRTLFKEHAMEFVTVLAIFNAVITFPFLLFQDLDFSANVWYLLILSSLIGSIAFIFVAKAVRHLELSHTSPLLAFGPAITTIVAFIFLNETLSVIKFGGIALIVFGAYTLEVDYKNHRWLSPIKTAITSKYIHYIFIALLLYSFSSTIDRYLLNPVNNFNISPLALTPIQQIFQAIIFIVLIYFFYDGFAGIIHGIKNAGKWIFLVSLFVSGYRLTDAIAISVPAAKVGLVLAIKRTSALFTTILAGEIFHESGLKQKIIACLIIMLGVYLIII